MFSETKRRIVPATESAWPPSLDANYSGATLRGFWADTSEKNRGILHDVNSVAQLMQESRALLENHPEATRISVRALTDTATLKQVIENPVLAKDVEAVIPLDGAGDDLDGLLLFYCGHNADPNQTISTETRNNLELVRHEPARPLADIIASAGDFSLRRLSAEDLPAVSDLSQLWEKFSFAPEHTAHLLTDPHSVVVAAFYNGRVVSVGRVEMNLFRLGGKELFLAEHTDASTLPEFENRGLYAAVAAVAMTELAKRKNPPHLTYGESNGSSVGVLKIARRLGRRFAPDTTESYGLPNGGVLPGDIVIEQQGKPKLVDLVPTFLTRSDLLRLTSAAR